MQPRLTIHASPAACCNSNETLLLHCSWMSPELHVAQRARLRAADEPASCLARAV
jgi:hypothetical protein